MVPNGLNTAKERVAVFEPVHHKAYVAHKYEPGERVSRGNKAGRCNMRALWHAAFISGLFLYSPARRSARARGVRPRMHVSISHEEYPMVVERTRVVSLVDQWDTLPRRIPCDYASIVVHHTTIER